MLVILSPASPLQLVILPPLPSHRCQAVQTHPTSAAPGDHHIKNWDVQIISDVLTLVHLPPSSQRGPLTEVEEQVEVLGIDQGRPGKQPAFKLFI